MTIRSLVPLSLLLLASACSAAQQEGATTDATSPELAEAADPARGGEAVRTPLPRIAYVYKYLFRLPSDILASTQERHVELCESLGSARCRVIDLKRSASTGDRAEASLTLEVAPPLARRFGQQLVSGAEGAGAETIDRAIDAEDLSKQIVDADARIRTKEALVRRLTALLETRSGNIAQAVEAERAINTAQEELEQARAWVTEMRGRVAMSKFEIDYEAAAALSGGFGEPIRAAFSSFGWLLGQSLGALIFLFAFLAPWLPVFAAAVFGRRWLRRRGWLGRSDAASERQGAQEAELAGL